MTTPLFRDGSANPMFSHGQGSKKHGRTRTYTIWTGIKQRCLNPKATGYTRYGGRGITLCDRWLDFENFFEDMGPCPDGLTIERKDNELGYYADNCVWATNSNQQRNTSRNRMVIIGDHSKSMAEWCEIYSKDYRLVQCRLRLGWNLLEALTLPIRGSK